MDQAATGAQHKTTEFISYSRVDGAFAERLRSALIARGFEAYLDKEDILPGEPWRERIDGLILAADAIVFVMSPSSITSEICTWEVGRALELKKSLTPLHWCVVPNHAVPKGLSERQYVFFDAYQRSGMTDEAAFEASLAELETALKVTDILWVREHTKWVARAVDWDQAEPVRPEGKLLRAADIAAVQGWARLKPARAPDMPQWRPAPPQVLQRRSTIQTDCAGQLGSRSSSRLSRQSRTGSPRTHCAWLAQALCSLMTLIFCSCLNCGPRQHELPLSVEPAQSSRGIQQWSSMSRSARMAGGSLTTTRRGSGTRRPEERSPACKRIAERYGARRSARTAAGS